MISVVVTCYDLGHTLDEALASVHAQTRAAGEIVVVDDGSQDPATRRTLERLARRGTRVVRTENRGVSAARNLGARLTAGDYLVCLDADDALEPTYFAEAAGRLDADPALEFVTCAKRAVEGASYVWTPSPPSWLDAVSTGGVPHVSSMLRRRVWDAVGGYDESVRVAEDFDFWATVFEAGFTRGVVLPEPLLRYRVRAGSRYHRAIQREAYVDGMRAFYAKHRPHVDRHGPELVVGREAFLLSQRQYQRGLLSRKAALAQELDALNAEIAGLRRATGGDGSVDWGDLGRARRSAGPSVHQYYLDRIREDFRGDLGGAVVEITGGTAAAALPAEAFDGVLLIEALETAPDVDRLLAEAWRLVKPGGALVSVVSALGAAAPGAADAGGWRFTPASLRARMAAVAPRDQVEVRSYGTLMACAAALNGVSWRALDGHELDAGDPAFPVVVAARAVKRCAGNDRTATVTSTAGEPGAVVLYHRIARLTPDPFGLCVAPEDFRAQMQALRRDYRPMPLEAFARAAATGDLPARAVAVTLDDGYVDALTVASPILMELGIPATFFVTAEDGGGEFAWDVLARVFLSDGPLPATLDVTLCGRHLRHRTATPEERRRAWDAVSHVAYPLDAAGRDEIVRGIVAWSGRACAPRESHRRLAAHEVRDLAARPGHVVGAHTVHHLDLPSQHALTRRWEMVESRARLARWAERPVSAFAYPYGAFTAAIVETARAAGFTAAVTCRPALTRSPADPLLLPRVEVGHADGARLPASLRAWA